MAKVNETPSIVLKVIHDRILKDNPNSTLTTKKMRGVMRTSEEIKKIIPHIKNSSWVFTETQAHKVRCMFDPSYAEKAARAEKRNAKASPAKRERKAPEPAAVAPEPTEA